MRELAELIGGGVSVESSLGRGSTFAFEVAISSTKQDPRDRPQVIPQFRSSGGSGGTGGTEPTLGFERLRREIDQAYPRDSSAYPEDARGDGEIIVVEIAKLPRPLTGSYLMEKILGWPCRLAESASSEKPPVKHFDGSQILLVEDNLINQKVGSRLLEKLGCRVDIAANGFQAVQTAGQLPYDLIFMDCQMPEMDGFQASRQIRLLGGALKRVGIVALTVAATSDDRTKCLDSGMNEYLTKPGSIKALARAIDRWGTQAVGSGSAPVNAPGR